MQIYNIGIRCIVSRYIMKRCIGGGYNEYESEKIYSVNWATYYILLSLVKPMHGYGIMQLVEEMTNGEVKLGPGTLYGNTTKLLKEKLIVEVASTDRKKCYELTPFGREVLELEYNRLQRSVKMGIVY